ncbi:hypothetical protein OPKNFCMD_3669 [Methylobacterium crusticola]|uniref:DUF4325 domain-containing protein n=1 Tax=Methylobacterium crusticola TaxID=1697972 RepID=A0ABQ4R1T3_9HYPH|nr:hypothetical protein [Methylobacterium crusticola]GJD50920.1 hypothetical protein OPKNFCMD_3669 [Methylobacterium crusticola]
MLTAKATCETTNARSVHAAVPEGALDAPIVCFDDVALFGVGPESFRAALCAFIDDVDEDGRPFTRKKIVAHLRGSKASLAALRRITDQLDAVLSRPEGPAN